MKYYQSVICMVITVWLLFTGLSGHVQAQDREYARRVIHALAADSMEGRGYFNGGDLMAARYIRQEFENAGVLPMTEEYFQPVTFSVNSIAATYLCAVDGKALTPGEEYYISARSKSRNTTYSLVWLGAEVLRNDQKMRKLMRKDLTKSLLVIDPAIVSDKELRPWFLKLFWLTAETQSPLRPAGIVVIQDKPGWQISDSGKETAYLVLTVKTGCINKKSKRLTINFDSSFDRKYISQNVAGMVRGTTYPDSVVLFTAHYDHLGMMGSVVLPGANDNASGVAMIMDLARYYAANPPAWTVGFIAFTGEEAGLLGSFHYADKPLIPLANTRLVINLDMVGTGSEGITLVNGSVYPDDFARLESLNAIDSLLPAVNMRGESPNSDHHPFHAAGVKSFFIYTMGQEFREYHNIYDRPEDLPLTRYNELFKLLTRFVASYMQ